MPGLLLCAVRLGAWSFCLHLAAGPSMAATPPPTRNGQEVEAVLAQTPPALTWDPVREEFAGDDEANRLRARHMREPWSL